MELNLFEEKVVEVQNGTQYAVLKQTIYNDKMYLFANELVDEETPSDTMAILRVDVDGENVTVTLEKDEKTINVLLNQFSEMLK